MEISSEQAVSGPWKAAGVRVVTWAVSLEGSQRHTQFLQASQIYNVVKQVFDVIMIINNDIICVII
jgi:hypothetical protein